MQDIVPPRPDLLILRGSNEVVPQGLKLVADIMSKEHH